MWGRKTLRLNFFLKYRTELRPRFFKKNKNFGYKQLNTQSESKVAIHFYNLKIITHFKKMKRTLDGNKKLNLVFENDSSKLIVSLEVGLILYMRWIDIIVLKMSSKSVYNGINLILKNHPEYSIKYVIEKTLEREFTQFSSPTEGEYRENRSNKEHKFIIKQLGIDKNRDKKSIVLTGSFLLRALFVPLKNLSSKCNELNYSDYSIITSLDINVIQHSSVNIKNDSYDTFWKDGTNLSQGKYYIKDVDSNHKLLSVYGENKVCFGTYSCMSIQETKDRYMFERVPINISRYKEEDKYKIKFFHTDILPSVYDDDYYYIPQDNKDIDMKYGSKLIKTGKQLTGKLFIHSNVIYNKIKSSYPSAWAYIKDETDIRIARLMFDGKNLYIDSTQIENIVRLRTTFAVPKTTYCYVNELSETTDKTMSSITLNIGLNQLKTFRDRLFDLINYHMTVCTHLAIKADDLDLKADTYVNYNKVITMPKLNPIHQLFLQSLDRLSTIMNIQCIYNTDNSNDKLYMTVKSQIKNKDYMGHMREYFVKNINFNKMFTY